jgi:transposase
MNEVTRAPAARVGVDIAKSVIQVHAVDAAGRVLVRRALKRDQFLAWCAQLPPGCLVAMEACSGAHHWGRELMRSGLQVRLIAPSFVTPYRMEGKGGKNDANDAAAICEAAGRPRMRFVPVKTVQQQSVLAIHCMREGWKEERTALINRARGVLTEAGLVFGKSPKVLRAALPDVIEDAANALGGLARLVLQQALEQWQVIEERLRWCDQQVGRHVREDRQARRAATITGVGELTASATVASVGDFTQFQRGDQFSAWLGLVPRQNSSGGKTQLGGITRRGDDYLRTLFIQGAKSAVMSAHKRSDAVSRWVLGLKERLGWQKACVALANKNARTLWVLMTREVDYDARHVPVKPAAKQKPPSQQPAAQPAPPLAA